MGTKCAILCRRYSGELTGGRGDYDVVDVEAFADPSLPSIVQSNITTRNS
jgi:hypothetical protein